MQLQIRGFEHESFAIFADSECANMLTGGIKRFDTFVAEIKSVQIALAVEFEIDDLSKLKPVMLILSGNLILQDQPPLFCGLVLPCRKCSVMNRV